MASTLVLERQAFVIDTQAMKQGRVEVMHMNRVFDDVVAVVVRLADGDARLDAAARQPNGVVSWVRIYSLTSFIKA